MKKEFEIKKQRKFSDNEDKSAFSVVRVQSALLKDLGGRNSWVKITCKNKSIYRLALGCKQTEGQTGFDKTAIELDYDSMKELGAKCTGKNEDNNFYYYDNLKIQPTNLIDKFFAHWNHPDPSYRSPMKLGIIGLILGFIGLILGIVGLITA